jgi:hypothetical protein
LCQQERIRQLKNNLDKTLILKLSQFVNVSCPWCDRRLRKGRGRINNKNKKDKMNRRENTKRGGEGMEKRKGEIGMVAHAYNPSTLVAEVEGL